MSQPTVLPSNLTFRIAHLYPAQLNMYGDRGNILALYRRCEWRGIQVEVTCLDLGDPVDPDYYDFYFMGGGQDTQQVAVCGDLNTLKREALTHAAAQGAVFLGICGGYQLLGHFYRPHQGPELKGLGLLDAYTIAGNKRFIGNVTIKRPNGETLVGFENHSGLTHLETSVSPLGQVLTGYGNNGTDKTEGAVFNNIYGTYLHGSLLPKNPALADELLLKALSRRYRDVHLPLLPDLTEGKAHQRAETLQS